MRFFIYLILLISTISCVNDISMPLNKGNLNEIYSGSSTNVNSISSSLNYSISDNGGASILESGINYSTASTFSTSEMISLVAKYPGNYSLSMSDLIPNKTYYWRPYAKTNFGYNYGDIRSFTTLPANTTNNNGLVTFFPFNGDFNDYAGVNNLSPMNGAGIFGAGKLNGVKSSVFYSSNFGAYKINSSNFPASSLSMTFWIKPNAVGSTLVSIGSNAAGPAYTTTTIKLKSRTELSIYHWNNDFNFSFSPYDFLDGSWYYIAFTYDSSTKKCNIAVYKKPINGTIVGGYYATYTLNNYLSMASYKNIAIGCLPDISRSYSMSEYFNGQIDDFRLFNRSISFDDIWYFSTL